MNSNIENENQWSFGSPVAINNEGEPKHLFSIYSLDGRHICDKKIISKLIDNGRKDMELICKAVNEYDKLKHLNGVLVKALKSYHDIITTYNPVCFPDDLLSKIDTAKEAIELSEQ